MCLSVELLICCFVELLDDERKTDKSIVEELTLVVVEHPLKVLHVV